MEIESGENSHVASNKLKAHSVKKGMEERKYTKHNWVRYISKQLFRCKKYSTGCVFIESGNSLI